MDIASNASGGATKEELIILLHIEEGKIKNSKYDFHTKN